MLSSFFQAGLWNGVLYLSVYRRPKIGVEAVSMSCSSTSPFSRNLGKELWGLDESGFLHDWQVVPARSVDSAESTFLMGFTGAAGVTGMVVSFHVWTVSWAWTSSSPSAQTPVCQPAPLPPRIV